MRALLLVLALVAILVALIMRHPSNAMVIIEPRRHRFLKQTIVNFDQQMDSTWDLYIFHGATNGDTALDAVRGITQRRVILVPLGVNNLRADEYNRLLKNPHFWNQIHAENILIFQTDAALCARSPNKIDRFMQYDYIGCSINAETIGKKNSQSYWNGEFYGVGGLSFRKKSFMLKCIADGSDKSPHEDVFYSNCVAKSARRPLSASDLNDFCTQNTFNRPSFGAHKTSLMVEKKDTFHQYCPEAKIIGQ
jgi:hypothetical protein